MPGVTWRAWVVWLVPSRGRACDPVPGTRGLLPRRAPPEGATLPERNQWKNHLLVKRASPYPKGWILGLRPEA